jgi:hypothetical protein
MSSYVPYVLERLRISPTDFYPILDYMDSKAPLKVSDVISTSPSHTDDWDSYASKPCVYSL